MVPGLTATNNELTEIIIYLLLLNAPAHNNSQTTYLSLFAVILAMPSSPFILKLDTVFLIVEWMRRPAVEEQKIRWSP